MTDRPLTDDEGAAEEDDRYWAELEAELEAREIRYYEEGPHGNFYDDPRGA